MIVLHAGSIMNRLLVWGEQPHDSSKPVRKQRDRKRQVKSPATSPFDVSAEGLRRTLTSACPDGKPPKKSLRSVVAWLPTARGAAHPASAFSADTGGRRPRFSLRAWRVTACEMSSVQTVDLLCRCMGKRTLGPGLLIGADLAWWAEALRLAGSLAVRQQYLPSLCGEEGIYRATWDPVLVGPDADRLDALARRIPAAARALSEEDGTAAPETPAALILRPFISVMVDWLVRSANFSGDASSRRTRKRKGAFDSPHDAWLHALRSADGIVAWEPRALAELARQNAEWRRPMALRSAAPFRLSFRLEEPETAGAPAQESWYVRYLLQPRDDLSLLIPVEEAWKSRNKRNLALNRLGADGREYLLSSLGQAAGICSRIEAGLKRPKPSGHTLDATGAHEFLTEKSLALEQAGFGVMLPAWWTRKGTKLRLAATAKVQSPKMQAGGMLSLDQVVRFDWEVALGNHTLTPDELDAMARLKAPLVRLRGQWVELSGEEIRAAVAFWKNRAGGEATVRDVLHMALGAEAKASVIEVAGVQADGWIGDLLKQLDGGGAFEDLPAPLGFAGTLRPYQARGYSWLAFLRQWGLGACLADDMGLGKTIQALAMVQRDWERNEKRPVLLVCPTSVVSNWQKEAERFTPDLPVMIHHGLTRKRGAAFAEEARKQALVISTYALLHRDIEHLREVPWGGVILDEAQNVKNPQTRQAQAARAVKADYRLALTGTPVENSVGDLWSLMEFLNPGFLGSQAEFKRQFFIPIQAGRDPEAAQRLKRITGPFILRRLKTDKTVISDLPEKQEMKVFCNLTKEQASLYAAVVKEAEESLDSAEGIQRKGLILATLSKLKQVCNHPAHFLGDNSSLPGRSGKLARLTEMIEEIIEVGDRALVFSQFSEMGELLRRHILETFGREVLFLHGGVSLKERTRRVERFQADGDGPPVFILSLRAGGTGLNLTRANHVFHFDRWWNPAVENQATDRAFRIGQTRNVQVHKFLCAGTLEEKIDEMIERKKAVAEQVVGAGEGWLTKLSNKELKELFALRKEAAEK